MALIKCPECGREKVSDSAEMCPDCGYAIKNHFDRIKAEEEEKRQAYEQARLEEQAKIEAEQRLERMCSPEAQQRTIERLNEKKRNAIKQIWISAICLVVFFFLLIWSWSNSHHGSLGFLILICLFAEFISFVMLVNGFSDNAKADSDLDVATKDMRKYYEQVQRQMDEAVASLNQSTAAYNAKHPACPNCGSRNTERISAMNRSASVALTGLASSKIGKQYECKNCKHKW